MSRDLPPYPEVSFGRIATELETLNGLVAAYLKFVVATARSATAMEPGSGLDIDRFAAEARAAVNALDDMINEATRG